MSGERFTGFESLFLFGCGSCHNDYTCELVLFSEPEQFGIQPPSVSPISSLTLTSQQLQYSWSLTEMLRWSSTSQVSSAAVIDPGI